MAEARARVWDLEKQSAAELVFKSQTVAGFFRFCGCQNVIMNEYFEL